MGCVTDVRHPFDGCAQTANGLGNASAAAVSPDGKSVYVASTSPTNAVVRLDRDPATGALTPKMCIADDSSSMHCAVTAGALYGLRGLVVSPDGRSLYTTASSEDTIEIFARSPTTGAIAPQSCIGDPVYGSGNCAQLTPGLLGVGPVAMSPDGTSLYVTSGGGALAIFTRDTTTGALSPAGCIEDPSVTNFGCAQKVPGLPDLGAIVASPDGKSLYVASRNRAAVLRFDRNQSTGALTPRSCVADNSSSLPCASTTYGLAGVDDLAVSPDGKSLYAVSDWDSAIVRFNRNLTTGAITPVDCIDDTLNGGDPCARTTDALHSAQSVAVSSDNRSVYVASYLDSAVVRFDRNTTSGMLYPQGCVYDPDTGSVPCTQTSPGLSGAFDVAVSPEGSSLYVIGRSDNAVARFGRASGP